MASVTITNLTSEPILLQELYTTLPGGKSMVVTRHRDELHAMPRLQEFWKNGDISVAVTSEVFEDEFIDEKLHLFQGQPGAILTATSTYHEPTIVPESGTNAPGQQPDLDLIGSTMVAHFTLNTDSAYRMFKVPANYVTGASFHVHWTKEEGVAGDGDESTNTVLWRISYTVFPGNGADINVAPTVLDLPDTYDDAGTTTRVSQRTADVAAPGFIAGYYVGMCIEAVTPTGTALTCEPALITADLTYTQYINQ
jgi:hypothetical protein